MSEEQEESNWSNPLRNKANKAMLEFHPLVKLQS